jgi:hypothetical protein
MALNGNAVKRNVNRRHEAVGFRIETTPPTGDEENKKANLAQAPPGGAGGYIQPLAGPAVLG